MKYELRYSSHGPDVELVTDHSASQFGEFTTHMVPVKHHVRLEKKGAVYCYGRCRWDAADLSSLFQWVRCIDDTVTPQDIIALSPLRISPGDVLGFYAELNEMGLSHL